MTRISNYLNPIIIGFLTTQCYRILVSCVMVYEKCDICNYAPAGRQTILSPVKVTPTQSCVDKIQFVQWQVTLG